jgi:hypothetical protein
MNPRSIRCAAFSRDPDIADAPPNASDQLIVLSIRAVLHFHPRTTLEQQEAAVEKTIRAVKDEIVRTQVDQTLCIHELWRVMRFTAQDVVCAVGEHDRSFEQILLWREGKPQPLTGDYLLKPGERLIVEPSLTAAIDIRPNLNL